MFIRQILAGLALGAPLFAAASAADAQQGVDAAYLKKLMTGAPAQIVRDATIARMNNGKMQTLKQGTNGFTCMVIGGDTPMCADANAMEWAHARATHAAPPDKTGFIYMLAGDAGVSNTDPFATKPEPGNHWVKTGPHVMIVGAAAKEMASYPSAADPNVKDPYVMWPGTPYAHLMLPTK
ncbi:MAG TPA: hypothetical protein VGF34_17195 [Stellaceae bacterium]|jgi:hypothetical protein